MTTDTVSLAAPLAQPAASERDWSVPARVGFRFALLWLVLTNFPSPLYFLPWIGEALGNAWWWLLDQGVSVAGPLLVGARPRLEPTGSGDGLYHWLMQGMLLIVSAIGAAIWTIVARRRAYPRALWMLHAYVRYALAVAMITYGAVKIIPSQFPRPSLDKLVQPFGDFSPMGVLWAFMGLSPGYTMFTGALELAGGLLLTTRRTALLGALITAGVMANVLALNLFYDVPVKLYSAHLLLMALFLAMPHLRRLANFFILDRPVERAPAEPFVLRRSMRIGWIVLRTACVAGVVMFALGQARQSLQQYSDVNRSPLRGIWNVETLHVDGVPRPALHGDASRWNRVIFDYQKFASLYGMDDRRQRFTVKLDEAKKSITLTSRDDPKRVAALTWARPDAKTLVLTGTLDGQNVRAVCRRGEEDFFLTARGFHWVQEKPLNR